MENEFYVGQKICCVNSVFDHNQNFFDTYFQELPEENITYTVREVDGESVLLEEIINKPRPFSLGGTVVQLEPGFNTKRFVPLDTKEESDSYADSILKNLEEGFTEVRELTGVEDEGYKTDFSPERFDKV